MALLLYINPALCAMSMESCTVAHIQCHNILNLPIIYYCCCSIKVPVGCTTELSYKGQQFLTQVFEKYDQDKDGMLNPTELKNVFSCCPRIPWHNLRYTVPTNDKVTYHDFAKLL